MLRTGVGVTICLLALLATVRADDYERNRAAPEKEKFREPLREPSRPASPSSYDPNDEAPPPDALPTPGTPGPDPRPSPGAPRPSDGGSPLDEIQIKANARARLSFGYDSNVFRAERGPKGDGFFHGQGEAQALVTFPQERELFASVSGEGITYFRENAVNETYGSSFVDYYHPLSSIFDVDLQNTFEYSAQNLLDDNGDLLPRAKFNAYDEEGRGTLVVHMGPRISLEATIGGRFKAFEDNPGLDSLSYWEARVSTGVRAKVWPDGRLKVRYVFRERRYLELHANLRREGTSISEPPRLELQRHQAILTFSQRAEILGMKFVATIGYTFTYNEDTFQSDRSYREHALSAHLEWWPLPSWTVFDFDARVGDRLFLVRRTLQRGDPRFGTRLEQGYFEITIGAWQRLWGPATRSPEGDFTNSERGVCLALIAETSWYFYHSTDVRSSYERYIVQGGIEASF